MWRRPRLVLGLMLHVVLQGRRLRQHVWRRPRLVLGLMLHVVVQALHAARWAVLGPLERRVLLLGRVVGLQPGNVVS